jgi:hypothetical protein
MENLYDLPTREDALDEALLLFFDLEDSTKEAFLIRIKELFGADSYELLTKYYEGLKLLGKDFSNTYKKQIRQVILPFLPKEEQVRLIRMEILPLLYEDLPQDMPIYEGKYFMKLFTKHIKEVASIVYTNPYNNSKDIEEVWNVERYVFLKKMQFFYEDCLTDLQFIWNNIGDFKSSVEEAIYYVKPFNLTFYIGYEHESDNKKDFRMNIRPNIIRKNAKQIEEVFEKNALPPLQGMYKELLENYIAEQELRIDYHQKSNVTAITVAQHDIKNVITSYKKSNKISQTMKLKLVQDLRVGKFEASISSTAFRTNIFNFVISSIFLTAWCALTFAYDIYPHFLIGFGILLYNIYNFFRKGQT